MDRLVSATETLTTKFQDHSAFLSQANNVTNDLLGALHETAAVASSMQDSFLSRVANKSSWWPYIIFPTASLVLGSYGLPPSMLRNIGLLAFGEAVGFVVSSYEQILGMVFGPVGEVVAANSTAPPL
jgi:hypothetical protein